MALKTEDEARQCWCPFAHDFQSNGGNRLRYASETPDKDYGIEMAQALPCIASACMAWRWKGWENWIPDKDPHSGQPLGYCGLAGKPE